MLNLLLIRHSEPVVDPEIPPSQWKLSDRGVQRAGLLAEYLADRGINALYSSGESKAVQTAEIVGTSTGLPVDVVHDLREHDRGNTTIIGAEKWRSLVIESIRKQDEHIYGFEPVGNARMRFGNAVERLMKPFQNDNRTVAVVAHGTVISTFVAELFEIDPIPIWESLGLPGMVEIEWPQPSKILTLRNFE